MYKVICLLCLVTFSYATNLIDIYLSEGIQAVEKEIQKKLVLKETWKEKLKDYNTTFGYYENLETLLVANKKKKTLHAYKINGKKLESLETYNVIVGKDGDKEKEGDLKTPLGAYDITKKFTPSDPFYGPLAYALSYPDTLDKVQGKNGYGIWIHGSPMDGSQRDPMSKGCIVMENDIIKAFDTKINPNSALTLVAEDEMPRTNVDELSFILAELYRWKEAWTYNNLEEYLSFYSEEFKRFDGKNKEEFSQMKRYVFSQSDDKEIRFSNINISLYPNIEGKHLFKVSFFEDYKSKRHTFKGNKELFVELKDGKFSIIVEK
jgi:murein L,D-transpeptidase YafK